MNPDLPLPEILVAEVMFCYTLDELRQACGGCERQLLALVEEGVLVPIAPGDPPLRQDLDAADLCFDAAALRTARTALRLVNDLGLNIAGAALVLELLSQIDSLRGRPYSTAC